MDTFGKYIIEYKGYYYYGNRKNRGQILHGLEGCGKFARPGASSPFTFLDPSRFQTQKFDTEVYWSLVREINQHLDSFTW